MTPPAPRTSQMQIRTAAYRRSAACTRFILALVWLASLAAAQAPPSDLARRVAEREASNEQERQNYTYRQTVVLEELTPSGARSGEYREVRDIIFSPEGERTERIDGQPRNLLRSLRMTAEDFRDIREVQPLLLTPERLWINETHY